VAVRTKCARLADDAIIIARGEKQDNDRLAGGRMSGAEAILLQKSAGSVGATFSRPCRCALKKHVGGSSRPTAYAIRDFPSRLATAVNAVFSSRPLSRRFSPPQFFDFSEFDAKRPPPSSVDDRFPPGHNSEAVVLICPQGALIRPHAAPGKINAVRERPMT
jgi:hypothetical protein